MNTVGCTQQGPSGFTYLYAYNNQIYDKILYIKIYHINNNYLFMAEGCRQRQQLGEPYAMQKVSPFFPGDGGDRSPSPTEWRDPRAGGAVDAVAVQFAGSGLSHCREYRRARVVIRDIGRNIGLDFREKPLWPPIPGPVPGQHGAGRGRNEYYRTSVCRRTRGRGRDGRLISDMADCPGTSC